MRNATGYTLVNGEERNKEHPDTFTIPCECVRGCIRPGDYAKLGFLYDDRRLMNERMWVQVKKQDPITGEYLGVLVYRPLMPGAPVGRGDKVSFEAKHVLDITERQFWEGDAAPRPRKSNRQRKTRATS
jgi:hypothetical protein